MKSTGIIRRIDDFGRIVIPKEIRKAKRIHDMDPLEIYVDDEFILLRKYDIGETPKDILDDFAEAIEGHPYRKRIMGLLADVRELLNQEKAPDAAATAIERKIR